LTLPVITGIIPAITGMVFRFGEEFDPKEIAEVVAAISNSGGGIIHLPDREDIEKLIKESFRLIDPSPSLPYIREKLEDKVYWVIYVPDGSKKPYVVNGRVLLFKEGMAKPASHREIVELIDRGEKPFEDMVLDAELSDINFELLEKFLKKIEEGILPEKFLRREGLIFERKPRVSAILLFGFKPETFIPGAFVEVNYYKFLSDNRIEVKKSFFGNIIEIREKVESYVLTLFEKIYDKEELKNLRIWFGEALENSLLHRDYSSPSPIHIWVFREMIKIWNPGESLLPIESLLKPHPSIRRNPVVYRIYDLGKNISGGSGTIKMAWSARTLNGAIEFKGEWGGFSAYFKMRKVEYATLNDRQKIFLRYLEEKGRATRKDYEKLTGVSERTARLDLADLLERKRIKRTGRGRNIVYILVSSGGEELFSQEF
jgi:predicted HTH transcriptional regulator